MIQSIDSLRETISKYKPTDSLFRPFELEFKMMTPVCITHPWIHLDGIIAHILLRKLLDESFYYLPSSMPINFFEILNLPLKKAKKSNLFIYHSSVSIFEHNKIYVDKIYKRFEDSKLRHMDPGRSRSINITSGRFKNYMITLPYLPTPSVKFYGNGDINEIKSLIKYLPGIGKKIAEGFGFFHSFSIKEIDGDNSIINENNEAMRPIPCEFLDNFIDYEKILLAYKFPYWAKSNVALCCNVGEIIKLKND